MKLLLFAQLCEAKATIKALAAQAIPGMTSNIWSEGEIPSCYRFEGGVIVLSNIGIHAAQMAAARFGTQATEIWNFGFAGSLNEKLRLGEIYEVGHVGKQIFLTNDIDPLSLNCVNNTVPRFSLHEEGHALISSDFPIHDSQLRERLGIEWDLVDMEGYGVVFASVALGKKCRLWKIVSDFASDKGRALIQKHKTELSGKLAAFITQALEKLS